LQRAQAAVAGGRFERLDPDAAEPGRRGGECLGCGASGGVLVGVRPDPVAVLEVDADVLDRFGGQLGAYERLDALEAGQRAVLVEGGQGTVPAPNRSAAT
jgi:hypothetical protein